jgi:Na+-transporting NADH:ubiquinone oxidoreductase subunit NqrD
MMKAYEFNISDDLFSLGLIILMVIAGGRPENFYSWQKTEKFLVGSFNMRYI